MWFAVANLPCPMIQGPVFDSSIAMAEAAARGIGVALVPTAMFRHEIETSQLTRPFAEEIKAGSYWLTWLKSKRMTFGMSQFHGWLLDKMRDESEPLA